MRRHLASRVLVGVVTAAAWACVLPAVGAYRLGAFSFLTVSRTLAMVPGAFGVRLRRHWYRRTLAACGHDVTVEWMTVFKTPDARVGARVFIGSFCWVAEADIRDDVMVASRTAIQGGGRTHGMERVDEPMNRQARTPVTVVIGPDAWIGTGATILADVAPGTVVAAGAVVTRTYPSRSVLAGVPARVLRNRAPREVLTPEPYA